MLCSSSNVFWLDLSHFFTRHSDHSLLKFSFTDQTSTIPLTTVVPHLITRLIIYVRSNHSLIWEVSGHIMDIETPSYLAGRPAFREYLDSNPWIARRKKINTFQSQ